MDNLKQYLQDHRAELDVEEPATLEWNTYSNKKQRNRKVVLLVSRWVAAACFLGLAGLGIYHFSLNSDTDSSATAKKINSQPTQFTPDNIGTYKDSVSTVIPTADENTLAQKTSKPKRKKNGKEIQSPGSFYEHLNYQFTSLINTQLKTIRQTPFYAGDENYFSAFKKQLDDLKIEEDKAKVLLLNSTPEHADLSVLISIYKLKIQLLEKLQLELNKMNNRIRKSKPDLKQEDRVFINI